jgi:arabinoxylan arabinofuranohydrolase
MPGTGDNARVIRLNPDMISLADASATTLVAPDFFEASFMHKRGGKYYFSYSTTFATHSATIDYMLSDNPMTGFVYAGTLLPNPAENNSNNNHHSVLEYAGKSYVFYHTRKLSNQLGYSDYQRSITLDYLTYAADGTIVPPPAVSGSVLQLKSVDARARIEAESMAAERGIETDFAQAAAAGAGVAVTALGHQDWIGYSQLDFGVGVTSLHARVASGGSSAANLEVWLDGCDGFSALPGAVIGSCTVNPTGGVQTWTDVRCAVTPTAGVHDLCLRASGDAAAELFRLDYFRFE